MQNSPIFFFLMLTYWAGLWWLESVHRNRGGHRSESGQINPQVNAEPVDSNETRVRRLIADLSSPNFMVRQNATEQLFEVGNSNLELLIEATRPTRSRGCQTSWRNLEDL